MTNITNECNIQISNLTSELWIKLQQPNSYIYTFPNKQYVYFNCPNSKNNLFLQKSGILTIDPGCQVKSENMEIMGFKTIETVTIKRLLPSAKFNINITEHIQLASQIKGFNIPNIEIPNIISFGQKQKLADISFGLRELNEMEENLTKHISPHALRNDIIIISSILTFVMIIIVIIIIKNSCKCYKKRVTRKEKRSKSSAYINNTRVPYEDPIYLDLSSP